ncbi:MAG: sugar nucleotide-binding protein [Planctomycetes bacterium]|nr:sugar nucleotide-binding protein [Planctomycetota bacterium]
MQALQHATVVFGGSGFVGRHVVRAALAHARAAAREGKRRAEVVISASREPEHGLDGTEDPNLVLATFDVATRDEPERLLDDLAPRRVILLTGMARIADCDAYPGYARALNVDLPARVARWTAARGARLVHVSTDLVFGAVSPPLEGFREEDEPAPVSNYGRTKLEGERNVRAADPAALVARLALCWDARGAGCGANAPLLDVLSTGARPALFTDEWRTPILVTEAATALVQLAHGSARGVLHVAGRERITRHELGVSLALASGVPLADVRRRIQAVTRAAAGLDKTRPADVCLDARRAREEHGLVLPGASEVFARIAREARARSEA